MAELAIWTFIINIVAFMYLTRYDKMSSVDYSNLYAGKSAYTQIAGKRVLILGSDWGLLENNKLASGFYEWESVKPIFTELDYFENVVLIDKALTKDAPEVIIDEENRMAYVFKRIPDLQTHYTRVGNVYFRK
jgi:hypothetical protein